jgi:hypothetical protein
VITVPGAGVMVMLALDGTERKTRTSLSVPVSIAGSLSALKSGARIMCGVIAIRISWSFFNFVLLPNRYPSTGMFVTPGIPATLDVSLRFVSPPKTLISPSLTRIFASLTF